MQWTEGVHIVRYMVFYGIVSLSILLLLPFSGSSRLLAQRASASNVSAGFVSLKSDRVNVRTGPGTEFPVQWVFTRISLPVEIIDIHKKWRRIRDSSGAQGWIYAQLLSRRRTGQIAPWKGKNSPSGKNRHKVTVKTPDKIPLHEKGAGTGRVIARLEPGVLVDLESCDGRWCKVHVNRFVGWVFQEFIWGIYPGEVYSAQ